MTRGETRRQTLKYLVGPIDIGGGCGGGGEEGGGRGGYSDHPTRCGIISSLICAVSSFKTWVRGEESRHVQAFAFDKSSAAAAALAGEGGMGVFSLSCMAAVIKP